MATTSKSSSDSPYSADVPIQSKKFDSLGRSQFAERLSDDLLSVNTRYSLVIGIYGAWGSGKTSIKNLLLEANHRKGDSCLPVVDFNPWQLSGTGSIPDAFFAELAVTLTGDSSEKKATNTAKRLDSYSKVLRLAGSATTAVGKAMPYFGIPIGSIMSGIGEGLRDMGDGLAEGKEALNAHDEALKNSIKEQKRILSASLLNLNKPILVVIDDIDRLTTTEILQVFQLVKANADFPNVIYLILFERKIVARALNKISGGRGMEFLEKIMQVGYHIPEASKASIEKILFSRLNQYIDRKEISVFWESSRFTEIYHKGLQPFFRNLRHVHRFMGSFAFQLKYHTIGDTFEVNPVDLIGLEVLRVFVPDIYEKIPLMYSVLTGLASPEDRKENTNWRDELTTSLIQESTETYKSAASVIVKGMFPVLEGEYTSSRSSEYFKMNRICHPDMFKKYFTLTMGDEDLTRFEVNKLLDSLSDSKKLERLCREFNKRGLLKKALEHLEEYKDEYDTNFVTEVISGMGAIENMFSGSGGFLVNDSIDHYALRIAYFGLKRIKDETEKMESLISGVERSKGLYIPIDIISMQERRQGTGREYIISEENVPKLIEVALTKIRKHSSLQTFKKHPYLLWILWRWSEWGDSNEVKKWVVRQLITPRDAIWFLSLILGEMNSYGTKLRIFYGIQLADIERFADIKRVAKLVRSLGKTRLNKREAIAVKAFQRALQRRSEGLSDNWRDRSLREHSTETEIVL